MTIVVAVDARHAACIIDIDIGIESIDRVLSLPLSVVPTTPRPRLKGMIGHSDRPPLFTYLPPHPWGYLPSINYIGVMMYLILYTCVCVCEKRTTRDGTGRTGLDDSDDDSDVIIVVFMCKQCGCGGTCTVVYCEHRWCVRVCVSVV